MKKGLLVFLFVVFFAGLCQAKAVRLGIINPTPYNLDKILYLIDHDYIDIEGLEIVGIFHKDQAKSIKSTNEYIKRHKRTDISISIIKSGISSDSLFVENQCTHEFEKLFLKTDGLLFLGGDDIPPYLYGEETHFTTELIPHERNWELSFLFHLMGGFQNSEFVPLLEKKPEYLILGICLGMQEMNVAGGGTLYQDIPSQIYQKDSYESVLAQDVEEQHKNYRGKLGLKNQELGPHFHHIQVKSDCLPGFKQKHNPLVATVHHQSIKKLGKDYQITATSMDEKVIEAIAHSKYSHVYGVQFHPEFTVLYKQQGFINAKNETVLFNRDDYLFHRFFWKGFSERLKKVSSQNK